MSKDDLLFFQALGDRVRELRHARKWTQEQLGEHCELHRTFIGSVERGERNLSLITLRRIALALRTTPEELIA